MEVYVKFLNELGPLGSADLDELQKYWVLKIEEYFAAQPLKLHVDVAMSVRSAIRQLLEQARKRQKDYPGVRFEATLLQHLVGAKLDWVLGAGNVAHHSSAEADRAEGRAGDFCVSDVAIHVTTAPAEKLLQKCAANLAAGLRPLVITLPSKIAVADSLAENAGIQSRIDILDIEQFLTANLYERALFKAQNHRPTTQALVDRYNHLIGEHETEASLKIETH